MFLAPQPKPIDRISAICAIVGVRVYDVEDGSVVVRELGHLAAFTVRMPLPARPSPLIGLVVDSRSKPPGSLRRQLPETPNFLAPVGRKVIALRVVAVIP